MIIASKGHIENVDSRDNPERVMVSLVMASPMRKSTFPLMDLIFDLCVKLISFFLSMFVCMFARFGQTPWFSLAHLCCAMEERRMFKSIYVNFGLRIPCKM